MKLIREGVQLSAEERNNRNRNWETIENETKNQISQIEQLVVAGDSGPQAAIASVSADGTVYPSLKARLDAEQQTAAALLADMDVLKATKEEVAIERARISNLTANAGDTDGNAELLDIRIGFDGVTYATAGDATRALSNYMSEENEPWEVV